MFSKGLFSKNKKKVFLIVFHFLVNNCYPCFLFSFLAFCVFGDDSNEILWTGMGEAMKYCGPEWETGMGEEKEKKIYIYIDIYFTKKSY